MNISKDHNDNSVNNEIETLRARIESLFTENEILKEQNKKLIELFGAFDKNNQAETLTSSLNWRNNELSRTEEFLNPIDFDMLKLKNELLHAQKLAKTGSWYYEVGSEKVLWTDELFAMFELDPLLGPPSFDVQEKLYTPSSWAKLTNAVYAASNNSVPYELELEICKTSGGTSWIKSVGTPVYNENKKVIGLRGVAIDITKEKLSAEQVKTTKEFYSNILRFAPDGIALLNKNQEVEFSVGADARKLNIDKGKKNKLKDIISEKDFDDVSKIFHSFFEDEKKHLKGLEFRLHTKNIDEIWIEATFSKGISLANETSIILNFKDITKKKKLDRELVIAVESLKSSNADLENFAYLASHDLQAPLNSIRPLIEILKSEYETKLDEIGINSLNFIDKSAKRMSDLIKALLDHSRIGRVSNLEKVDCNSIINEVEEDLKSEIVKTNATIMVSHLPTISGYKTELRLMFQNLITNALKFTRTDVNPVVEIMAKREQNSWIFSIIDNGVGIRRDAVEDIFIIFKRQDNSSNFPGTGIGLAHVKKIVNLHGGSISVESDGKTGSTFQIKIPEVIKD